MASGEKTNIIAWRLVIFRGFASLGSLQRGQFCSGAIC